MREARGTMPEKEAAKKLCVSVRTLQHWERGTTSPRLDLLPILAARYGVRAEWLACGSGRKAAR